MKILKTHEKIRSGKTARFLVLLPHRDSRNLLENYRQKLFAFGFAGAYSFPPAAPLALLSRSLDRNELKQIAREIRKITLTRNGKITAGNSDTVHFPAGGPFENAAFFGPVLDLQPPESIPGIDNEKTLYVLPKAVLCAAVTDPANSSAFSNTACLNPPDLTPFSFRAAIITNLVIRPLENGAAPFSFEWRLGPECWLPAYK